MTQSPVRVLSNACPVCSSSSNLLRCSRCKVISYCCRDHQASHFRTHKAACSNIHRARENANKAENDLRHPPPNSLAPPNAFENEVGCFWAHFEPRSYLQERIKVVKALAKIKSRDSVEAQLEECTDIIRLGRADEGTLRAIVPFLMIRLDMDQQAYEFIKWWSTTAQREDYRDMAIDMSKPFLDIEGADALEETDGQDWDCDLAHLIALILLKLKFRFDVQAIGQSAILKRKLPQELVDETQRYIPRSPVISVHKNALNPKLNVALIQKLTRHFEVLTDKVSEQYPHFWPMLLGREKELSGKLPSKDMEELRTILQSTTETAADIPGALETLKLSAASP